MYAKVDSSIRIMLIECQTILRAALRLLVESCPNFIVVGAVGPNDDAVGVAETEQPDIIILEPDLRCEDNTNLITELIDVASAARVILLTAEIDSEFHRTSIRQGAMGIVLMNEPVETLVKAIQKVHAGEMWIDRSMTARVITEMRSKRNLQCIEGEAGRNTGITAREREIITLIAEGLNNQQIADHLYLSKATVRHHITSIFSKVEVSDRIGLLIYSYRHGLVDPPRRSSRSA